MLAAAAVPVDGTDSRPRVVRTRFELAAIRLTDAWLGGRRVCATAEDLRIAREFLEDVGLRVEELPGLLVSLHHRDGRSEEMTREAVVLVALRRLAARSARLERESRRRRPPG